MGTPLSSVSNGCLSLSLSLSLSLLLSLVGIGCPGLELRAVRPTRTHTQTQKASNTLFYKNLHCGLSPSSPSSSSPSLRDRGRANARLLECTHMGRSSENAGLLELPENVSCVMQLLPASHSQDQFKEYPPFLPSLEQPLSNSCFQNLRCKEGGDDEDFYPLRQANAELKSEQSSLLLKNSELLSQTLLLKLENQRLKRQLELQLQKKHSDASFSCSSSSLEESSNNSDNDEEANLEPVRCKDIYMAYDSS